MRWQVVGKQTGKVYLYGDSHADVIRHINGKFWEKPPRTATGRNMGGIRPTFLEPLMVERILREGN